MLGHAPKAPYDSIVAAAGGNDIPQAWLDQLAVGGRLVAPVARQGGRGQVLVVVDRRTAAARSGHEAVQFVPLKSGLADDDEDRLGHVLDRSGLRRWRSCRRCWRCYASPRTTARRSRSARRRGGNRRGGRSARRPRRRRRDAPSTVDANTGKAGYYTVKPGDTLIRIGLENGQNWKDLTRWNNLANPNIIEVGQVIRIVPPGVDAGDRDGAPGDAARVETRPLEAQLPRQPRPASRRRDSARREPARGPRRRVAAARRRPARDGDDDMNWAWPAAAPVATPFDEARNKGLVFRGKAGDPILPLPTAAWSTRARACAATATWSS